MLLGKRPRQGHPMKRTTSMTEFTLDPTHANGQYPCADQIAAVSISNTAHSADPVNHYPFSTGVVEAVTLQPDQNNSGVAVPVAGMACGVPVGGSGVLLHHQMQRRHSANCADNFNVNGGDTLENTPHFLRDCSLCQRRLVPGRDIYMYRGDSAFCSLECRQQQISLDLRKQKGSSLMSLSANNGARNEKAASSPNSSTTVSGTAAAAI